MDRQSTVRVVASLLVVAFGTAWFSTLVCSSLCAAEAEIHAQAVLFQGSHHERPHPLAMVAQDKIAFVTVTLEHLSLLIPALKAQSGW